MNEDSTSAPEVTPVRPSRSKDITRNEAMRRTRAVFGPEFFARKKTKTKPGNRKQIGKREAIPPFRVVVVGSGKTWLEATQNSLKALGIGEN